MLNRKLPSELSCGSAMQIVKVLAGDSRFEIAYNDYEKTHKLDDKKHMKLNREMIRSVEEELSRF